MSTSQPVIPRGIDYASISMLQLETTVVRLRLFSWNIPIPFEYMISFGYLIRLIYSLFYKNEKSSTDVEAFWISDSIKLTKVNRLSSIDSYFNETYPNFITAMLTSLRSIYFIITN